MRFDKTSQAFVFNFYIWGKFTVMKNLFNSEAANEILVRLEKLQATTERQWGKMNVDQMLAHCTAALEVAADKVQLEQAFIGKILGPFVKKSWLSEKPFQKHSPTDPHFIIKTSKGFDKEKEILTSLVKEFQAGGPEKCTNRKHSFFGTFTKDEWATLMYKHLDHHLRQFNA